MKYLPDELRITIILLIGVIWLKIELFVMKLLKIKSYYFKVHIYIQELKMSLTIFMKLFRHGFRIKEFGHPDYMRFKMYEFEWKNDRIKSMPDIDEFYGEFYVTTNGRSYPLR